MGTRRRFGGAWADTVSGSKAGQAGIKTLDKTWGWSWRPGTLQPVAGQLWLVGHGRGWLQVARVGCGWLGQSSGWPEGRRSR